MLSVFNQFIEYVNLLPSPWNTIVKYVAVIGLFIAFIVTNFALVHYGTKAVKLRWGKMMRDKDGNPMVYNSGFPPKWVFPKVVKLVTISILDRQIEVQASVSVDEYYLFNVTAVLNFSATDDVDRIVFVVEDLEPFLRGRGLNALRESMTWMWHRGDRSISNAYVYNVQREFERIINPRVARVGLHLESIDLNITDDPQMAIARAIASHGPKAIPTLTPKPQVVQNVIPPAVELPYGGSHQPVVVPAPVLPGTWMEATSTAFEHGEDSTVFGGNKPRSLALWHRTKVTRL